MTGALNRGAVIRIAERALTEAAAQNTKVGLIMADIDLFKAVNDSFGHLAGDATLKEFTRRLAGAIRQTAQFGRYGGEEYLIIKSGANTHAALKRTVERLREAIVASPFTIDGKPTEVSASFGATLSDGAGVSVEDVIAAADRALYAAKEQGRNRVVVGR